MPQKESQALDMQPTVKPVLILFSGATEQLRAQLTLTAVMTFPSCMLTASSRSCSLSCKERNRSSEQTCRVRTQTVGKGDNCPYSLVTGEWGKGNNERKHPERTSVFTHCSLCSVNLQVPPYPSSMWCPGGCWCLQVWTKPTENHFFFMCNFHTIKLTLCGV